MQFTCIPEISLGEEAVYVSPAIIRIYAAYISSAYDLNVFIKAIAVLIPSIAALVIPPA